MNCQQVKKYVYAFLDSRTDLEQNLQIQEHIESCCSCSAELKIEDRIGRILSDLTIWESCPKQVIDRMHVVIANMETEQRTKSIWDYRKSFGLKLFAIAASILLVVSLAVLMRSYTAVTKLPREVKEIASDHRYVELEKMPLDIVSSDMQNVRDKLFKKVQFSFDSPMFTNYAAKIVGGRVCIIGGKKGAHIVYRLGSNLVSFYALHEIKFDFSSLESFELKGKRIYKAEDEGHRIFIWKQDTIYCALVSTFSEDQMIKIMSSIIDEGSA